MTSTRLWPSAVLVKTKTKLWVPGAQSRGLIKPGLSHCYGWTIRKVMGGVDGAKVKKKISPENYQQKKYIPADLGQKKICPRRICAGKPDYYRSTMK